jgi:hypothetical protein
MIVTMGVMMFDDSEIPAEVQDEMKWDELFAKPQGKLIAAARKAREEIARGLAVPLDLDRLETTTTNGDSSGD